MPSMDITEAVVFIRRVMQIAALTLYEAKAKDHKFLSSRPLKYYAFATLIASIGMLFYGFFGMNRLRPVSVHSGIGETIDILQFTAIHIAHIVTVTEAFIHRHYLNIFMKNVREIDGIFEHSLNVDVDNRSLHKQLIRRAIKTISLYLIVIILITITKSLSEYNSLSIYYALYLLPFCVSILRYYQIMTCIIIIRERLKKLVIILNELKQSTDESVYLNRSLYIGNVKRLQIIRDLYNRLWALTGMVNRNFRFSLLANIGNDFLAIISNSYWIFISIDEHSSAMEQFLQTTSSAISFLPYTYNVLSLALLCEETLQKTTEIALAIHNLGTSVPNDHHYNVMIEQFSLQLLHQRLTFCAAGFFNINCALLYTIAGATTTYLIILIQFHVSADYVPENCTM